MSCDPSSEVVAKLYRPDRPTVRKPVHRTLNRSGGTPSQRRRILLVDGWGSTTENAGSPFHSEFVKYSPTSPSAAPSAGRTTPRRVQTSAAASRRINGPLWRATVSGGMRPPKTMATPARHAQNTHASAAVRGSDNRVVPVADSMRVPAVRTPATAAEVVIASSSPSEVCVQNLGGSTPEITGRIVASRILCIIQSA